MPRLHPVRCAVSLLLVMEGAVVFLLLGPNFPSLHSSPRPMTAQHRASSAPPLNCTISLDHCREDDDHDHHNTNFGDRCSLKELTKDCESFLRAHRYMDTDVRREEREFALAFSVRMHRSVPSVSSLYECTYQCLQCLLCPNAPVSVFSVRMHRSASSVSSLSECTGQCLLCPNAPVSVFSVRMHLSVSSLSECTGQRLQCLLCPNAPVSVFSVRMHRSVSSVSSLSECTCQCLLCPNAPVSVFSVFSVRMHLSVSSVSSLSECTCQCLQCLLCPNAPVSVFSVRMHLSVSSVFSFVFHSPLFMFVPHFVAHFQFPLFAPKYFMNFCLFSLPFLVPG